MAAQKDGEKEGDPPFYGTRGIMTTMTFTLPGLPNGPSAGSGGGLPALPRELDEAGIAAQQAAARGQLLARLERLFRLAEDNVEGLDGEKPDPRWAELAVRILDREAKLYRLDRPEPEAPPEPVDEAQDTARVRLLVLAQVDELASRTAPVPVVTVEA